jgi:hypothetical protein
MIFTIIFRLILNEHFFNSWWSVIGNKLGTKNTPKTEGRDWSGCEEVSCCAA